MGDEAALDEMSTHLTAARILIQQPSDNNTPIFMVAKRGGPNPGKKRFVQDFRKRNAASKDDKYTIKDVRESLVAVGRLKPKIWSKLDFTGAFYCLSLEKESQKLTSFTLPFKNAQYSWARMPQGLKGASASFSKLCQIIFRHIPNIITYIDDLVGATTNHTEMIKLLNEVFAECRYHGMKLNLHKCQFGLQSLSWLGYNMAENGISPDIEKAEAVKSMILPTTIKEIQSYLGLFQFFSELIDNYAIIAGPLSNVTSPDHPWRSYKLSGDLPTSSMDSWYKLRNIIASRPVIPFPDFSLPFQLFVDASMGQPHADPPVRGGVGAILTQIQNGIADIHNTIFAQNFATNILPYTYMGVLPIHISSSSSQTTSSTTSDDSDHDNSEEGSGFFLNLEESNNPDEQTHLGNHVQVQNDQEEPVHQDEQIETRNHFHITENQQDPIADPLPNTESENEYQMNLQAETNIIKTTSNNDTSTSSELFYSPESSAPSNSTLSPDSSTCHQEPLPNIQNDQQQIRTTCNPLSTRYNDITFLDKINSIDKTPKEKPIYIISSVRPSFSCSTDQDFFLCHLCHSLPKHGDEWEKDKNEYPFVRNIGSIWKHISMNHCNIEPEENRQLHKKVEKYVLFQYNELRTNPHNQLLQMKTSIPKSLSTSCIRTAWKSNQTEITKEVVNTYFFHKKCRGHRRLFYTKGVVYNHDLAISMYCSCNAKLFPKKKLEKYAKP